MIELPGHGMIIQWNDIHGWRETNYQTLLICYILKWKRALLRDLAVLYTKLCMGEPDIFPLCHCQSDSPAEPKSLPPSARSGKFSDLHLLSQIEILQPGD